MSFTGGRSAVEPIQLDSSFLRLSPTNRSISVQPALRRRLERIKPAAAPFQFQLRPFVTDGVAKTNRDLFAHWPARYRPAASLDLNFAELHRHLTNELQRLEAGRAKLDSTSQELREARDQILIPAHDLPLGRLVGARPNDPLHSFGSYCQQSSLASAKNPSPTNQLFLGYLRKLLERGKAAKAFDPEAVFQQLDSPKTIAQALQDIHSLLIPEKPPRGSPEIPPDYFLSKWQKLKYEDDLSANQTIKAEVDREAQRLAALLPDLPEDLASLSRLSLLVVASGRQFELIRFPDLAKQKAP
ncbi:MAG: hypothetical protein HY674_11970 [Chloroflexi bacterium]|nr:hypothetical protein [Chloroflexota bacterium]